MLATMRLDQVMTHIQEFIKSSNDVKVKQIRDQFLDEEIIADLWITAMHSDAKPAKNLRTHYDGWTGEDKLARQHIKIFCLGFISNKLREIKRRAKIMNERSEEVIQNTMSKSLINVRNMMFGYSMSEDERIIALWKCDLISEDDAMEALAVKSRTTLYNRWNNLKERIRGDK